MKDLPLSIGVISFVAGLVLLVERVHRHPLPRQLVRVRRLGHVAALAAAETLAAL